MKEANSCMSLYSNAKEISEWLADLPRNADTISVEWSPTKQYIGNLLNNRNRIILQFISHQEIN